MANIRIPEEARPFLSLCRRHDLPPDESAETPCFETYADLLVFAASLGFSELGGRIPQRKTRFLEKPYPIDFQIFKNDRRYPPLLLIALAASGDQNVVRDEESICKLAEDFSAVGCQRLKKLADKGLPGMIHLTIAGCLAEFTDTSDQIQI